MEGRELGSLTLAGSCGSQGMNGCQGKFDGGFISVPQSTSHKNPLLSSQLDGIKKEGLTFIQNCSRTCGHSESSNSTGLQTGFCFLFFFHLPS